MPFRKFVFIFLLISLPMTANAVDISLFINNATNPTDEEQAAINFLDEYGFDYKVIDNLSEGLTKVLWIHSSERNKPDYMMNKLSPQNQTLINYIDDGGKILLTHNAIKIIDYLGIEGHPVTQRVRWNPWDDDKIYIIFEKQNNIINYPLYSPIFLWQQKHGQDYSIYFLGRDEIIKGDVITHEMRYWNKEYHDYVNSPLLVLYDDVILFRAVRLNSSYSPSQDMKKILNASLAYLVAKSTYEPGPPGPPSGQLVINITNIGLAGQGDKINITFDIYRNSTDGRSYIGDLTSQDVDIIMKDSIGQEMYIKGDIYWATCLNGSYTYTIEKPRFAGRLLFNLSVFIDDVNVSDEKPFVMTTRHERHLMIISDKNFWNLLFSSTLDYPVLTYEPFEYDIVERFISVYRPNEIFSLVDATAGGYRTDRESVKVQWPGAAVIWVDRNRTKGLWASAIAQIMNMRLTKERSDEPWICTFSCNVSGARIYDNEDKLRNYYIDILKSTGQKINYLVVVNSNSNLSGLMPELVRDRRAFPVIVDIDPAWTNEKIVNETRLAIRETLDRLMFEGLLSDEYLFDNTMFLGIIGIPLGLVKDPADEYFNDKDGDYLETDVFYGDSDGDGYQDLAVGRFSNAVQIANIDLWDKNNKNVLIGAQYRSRSYLDLLPNGMDEGMVTHWALDLYGFNVKRLIEERLAEFTAIDKQKAIDEAWTWKELEHLFVQEIMRYLGVNNYINWAVQAKYILVETDWERFFEYARFGTLDRLTKKSLLEYLNRHGTAYDYNIFFYFGPGDKEKWLIRPQEASPVSDPYPISDETVYADDLKLYDPKILFLEHDMSANSRSKFLCKSNLALIGETGILHQINSMMTLGPFIQNIVKSKPIGKAVEEMHDIVIWGDNNEEARNRITFGVCREGINNALKEHYTRILYGDPALVIDPIDYGKNNWVVLDNQTTYWSKETNYSLVNGTIIVNDADNYLLEYNKPVIPLYQYRIILPKGADIEDIKFTLNNKTLVANPYILEPDDYYQSLNFTGVYPRNTYWNNTKKLIDGRSVIILTIAPVQYNDTKATIIEKVNVSIKYSSPADILSFRYENITPTRKKFILRIKSDGEANLTLRLENEQKEDINQSLDFVGIKDVIIEKELTVGSWKATAVLRSADCEAGPKSVLVDVKKTKQIIMPVEHKKVYGPGKITEKKTNAFETIEYGIEHNLSYTSYWNVRFYIKIEKSPDSIKTYFTNADANLEVISNISHYKKILTCPKGFLMVDEYNGTADETFNGDYSELSDIMNQAIAAMNNARETAEYKVRQEFDINI